MRNSEVGKNKIILATTIIVAIVVIVTATVYVWVNRGFETSRLKIKLGIEEVNVDDDNISLDSVTYSIRGIQSNRQVFWKDIIVKIDGESIWDGNKLAKGWQVEMNGHLINRKMNIEETNFRIISRDPSKLNRNSFVQILITQAYKPEVIWQSLIY